MHTSAEVNVSTTRRRGSHETTCSACCCRTMLPALQLSVLMYCMMYRDGLRPSIAKYIVSPNFENNSIPTAIKGENRFTLALKHCQLSRTWEKKLQNEIKTRMKTPNSVILAYESHLPCFLYKSKRMKQLRHMCCSSTIN